MDNQNSIYIGTFDLGIRIPGKEFKLQGHFTKSRESIYAHINQDELRLIAGSQDHDEKRAMLKALFRLINQIELNLIYSEDLQDDSLKAFKTFLEKHKRKNLLVDDNDNIPVYSEEIKETPHGLSIQAIYKGQVTNLNNITNSYPEQIHESIVSTLEESGKRTSGTVSYSYKEEFEVA
jgi:hypothetical protein